MSNSNWKAEFYGGAAWKSVRDFCFRRDKGLCQDCLQRGLVTAAEEVHHTVRLSSLNHNDPDVSLNPERCVSLCRKCHAQRHSNRIDGGKRYTVDELGHVTILPPSR